ncbi:DMT family transporter [Treponema sp.]
MQQLRSRPSLSHPVLAAVLASVCALLWGSAYPGIKAGYELFSVGADNTAAKLMFAGVRFTLAGGIVLILRLFVPALRSSSPARVQGVSMVRKIGMVLSLGLAQTGLQYCFFYIGLSYTTGAKGSIINSTSVFFSAILAHLVYHNDKLHFRKSLGIALGFLAVILVNWQRGMGLDFALRGEGFIMLSAFILSCTAIYSKWITDRIEPVLVSGSQLMCGGIALVLVALLMGESFPTGGLAAWAVLGYLALLSSIAFTLWTSLLKYNKVSFISVFNFLIPVAGTALSALVLREKVLQVQYLIAVPAVAVGIFLVNSAAGTRKKVGIE